MLGVLHDRPSRSVGYEGTAFLKLLVRRLGKLYHHD